MRAGSHPIFPAVFQNTFAFEAMFFWMSQESGYWISGFMAFDRGELWEYFSDTWGIYAGIWWSEWLTSNSGIALLDVSGSTIAFG